MRQVLALTLEKIRAVWPTTLRSRFGWAFLASVIVVTSVLLFQSTAAAGETAGNFLITGLASIMLAVANLAIGLCIFFLRFFIAIASYNNYIDVDVVQLGWVMVRDVANMFFVVALLVIAFGTILGLEEYEWKKNLVKLVLAAIFINFSNLIAQLFIDVAHIFTMTFLNAISATAGGNLINMFKLNEITNMVGVDPNLNTEFDVEILLGTMVAATFAVLAAFAMGSYVFVMMARVVALWALIILSPLAYILGVLPKTQSYAERWWSEFSNYVIVAPVMVFFLWLSFATLGTGTIMSSIQADIPTGNRLNGSKSVELQGANFVESNDPSKISLSRVSTWENMANFLIALAFLRVGVKTTEETGVWGSDMVSDAWSFGKNMATIATGYAAGRWLAGKGQDTLKTGASRVFWAAPIVGGRALGTYVDRAKIGLGNLEVWRNEKAKQWEDPSKQLRKIEMQRRMGEISDSEYQNKKADIERKSLSGSTLGRGLRLLGATLIQSGGRADKKAEDWAKAVDSQKSFIEENYSTSDSSGGRVKLDWGIKAHKAEEMASAKKDQKYAEGEKAMMFEDELAQNKLRQKLINEGKSPPEIKEALKNASAGTLTSLENTIFSAKAASEKAHGQIKIHSDGALEKARRTAGVYDVKNQEEEAAMNLAEQVADARADAYLASGDPLRADAVRQAARAERLKKDGELFGPMGYDELMIKEQSLNDDIAKALSVGDGELANKLRRQKVALAILNSKTDPDQSRDGRAKSLARLGITEMNDGDRLKNELSRLVGVKVKDEAEGMALFSQMYNGDAARIQAALSALSKAYKAGGSAGDAGGLGLIKATLDQNGISKYEFRVTDPTGKGDDHTSTGSTSAFVRYMSLNNINDITGLSGKYRIESDGNRVNTGISDRGKAVLKELFSGKDARAIAQIKPAFLKSLDATDLSVSGADVEIRDVFAALQNSMPPSGYDALKHALPNLQRLIP